MRGPVPVRVVIGGRDSGDRIMFSDINSLTVCQFFTVRHMGLYDDMWLDSAHVGTVDTRREYVGYVVWRWNGTIYSTVAAMAPRSSADGWVTDRGRGVIVVVIRVLQMVMVAVALVVCVVGGLALPVGVLLVWAILGLVVGVFGWCAAQGTPQSPAFFGSRRSGVLRSGRPSEAGIVWAAATFAGCLLVVGTVVFLMAATGPLLLIVGSIAVLTWLYRHHARAIERRTDV